MLDSQSPPSMTPEVLQQAPIHRQPGPSGVAANDHLLLKSEGAAVKGAEGGGANP